LMTIRVTNAGPDAETIHVLPTAWYRNTWAWEPGEPRPQLRSGGAARVLTDHPFLGPLELEAQGQPTVLFCENETNARRLFGVASATKTPKDGINDHVVWGSAPASPPSGSKVAFWSRLDVAPGATATVRVRLRPASREGDPWPAFDAVSSKRLEEADEFYGELTPAGASQDE